MNSWSSVVAGLRQSHELEVLGYGEEETTSRGVMSDEEEREKGFGVLPAMVVTMA